MKKYLLSALIGLTGAAAHAESVAVISCQLIEGADYQKTIILRNIAGNRSEEIQTPSKRKVSLEFDYNIPNNFRVTVEKPAPTDPGGQSKPDIGLSGAVAPSAFVNEVTSSFPLPSGQGYVEFGEIRITCSAQ